MSSAAARDENGAALQAEGGLASSGLARISNDDFDRDVWCVLGVPIDVATVSSAADMVESAVRLRRPLSFVTPNLSFLSRASRDPEARREIIDADLSLADGAPVAFLARLFGAPLASRAAGSDVFEALRARPAFRGRRMRVFFFGGRAGAAEAAARALQAESGFLEPAGFLDPGHGDVASMSGDAVIDAINRAEPDFVVVALGAAKGQAWIDRNRGRLSAPVIAHLGAVVDFTGGTIRRAPVLWRRLGAEWAWRVLEEPSLWRRYAGDAAWFVGAALFKLPPILALARRRSGTPGTAGVLRVDGRTEIILSGDVVAGSLAPVRQAFRAAAAAGAEILVDATRIGGADCAFLGLVMMLEKHARRTGGVFWAGTPKWLLAAARASGVALRPADGRAANSEAAAA